MNEVNNIILRFIVNVYNMKQLVLAVISFFLVTLPTPTFAQYQYISTVTQPKQVFVDKKLLNPQNNQFVDNLNIEQHAFLPDQDVTFRITVTNNSQSDQQKLTVADKLPDVLNFVSASFGNFDQTNKTLNLTIDKLKVGESKIFELKTKVKPVDQLPGAITCQTNLSKVTVSNMIGEDTATFCVSKQVLGVTTEMPKTGPSQTLPLLVLSSLFLAIGLLIKRIIFLERR